MRDCLYNVLAVHYYMEGNGARLCLYSIYQFQWYLLLEWKITWMSKNFNTWSGWEWSLSINVAFSKAYLIAGCKFFRQFENYSKSSSSGQKIRPSCMYRLKTFINSYSSIGKYFGNSWVKSLVSSWYPIGRQAYGGAHLVPMAVPKTWMIILESKKNIIL